MAFDWRMRSQPSFQKILREDDELPHRLEVAKSRNRPFIQFGMPRFAVIGVIVLRTLSQGRKTTRERNLNARVILVTVAWPELPLTLF